MKFYGSLLIAMLSATCVMSAVEEEATRPEGKKTEEPKKDETFAYGGCKHNDDDKKDETLACGVEENKGGKHELAYSGCKHNDDVKKDDTLSCSKCK
jgi:hypothetical protein